MSDTQFPFCGQYPEATPPPDLTGADSQYYHANDRYGAYMTGQQVIFDQTLYQQGMIITPEGSTVPWVYGTDWTVNSNDVDTDTMTVAVGLLSGFNKTLLKSITILHAQADLPLFINMATQSFYPRPEHVPMLPAEDNAFVALMENLEARVNQVETETHIVNATTSTSQIPPALLAFDITGTNPANLITNEIHTVNTFGHMNTIRPTQGSFFKDSLILSINGIVLTAGVDYMAVGLNNGKTKITPNTSGIYDLILLTYAYTGPVSVTYHAVGGDASVADLSAVYENLNDIRNFLSASGFLTADELATSSTMRNLLNKTCAMENQMRVLLSPPPNYGDSTNGASVVKNLRAPDTGLHWWTIGRLYQVSGSTQIVQSDRMVLAIQMVGAKLIADVGISFDLTQPRDTLVVNASNVIQDVQFGLYGSTGTPANVCIPQFRVLWNADSTYVSGALLQIGLNLPNFTDVVAIEDHSGIESCWLLDMTQGTLSNPLTPNDNTLVLPSGSNSWVSGAGTSVSSARTMPNGRGYLLWGGTKSLATFDTTIGLTSLTHSLPSWFILQDISEVVAEFTDASGNPSSVYIPMTGLTATQRRGIGMVYLGQDGALPVPMELTLAVSGGVITAHVEVHVSVQTAPIMNLRYLVARVRNSTI